MDHSRQEEVPRTQPRSANIVPRSGSRTKRSGASELFLYRKSRMPNIDKSSKPQTSPLKGFYSPKEIYNPAAGEADRLSRARNDTETEIADKMNERFDEIVNKTLLVMEELQWNDKYVQKAKAEADIVRKRVTSSLALTEGCFEGDAWRRKSKEIMDFGAKELSRRRPEKRKKESKDTQLDANLATPQKSPFLEKALREIAKPGLPAMVANNLKGKRTIDDSKQLATTLSHLGAIPTTGPALKTSPLQQNLGKTARTSTTLTTHIKSQKRAFDDTEQPVTTSSKKSRLTHSTKFGSSVAAEQTVSSTRQASIEKVSVMKALVKESAPRLGVPSASMSLKQKDGVRKYKSTSN